MNRNDAKERAEKLRGIINDYRYHYHVLDESIMSEAAADSLKHELSQIEAEYPDLITVDSPTQRVAGGISKGFKKVTHNSRMLSLNDVFNQDEVEAWVRRIAKLIPGNNHEYFCDVKMDGLACSLIYMDGVLVQAVTRGDGLVGEDVTKNIRTISNIPLSLRANKKYPNFLIGRTEVRGEVVMFKADFDSLNRKRAAEGLPIFANPRNLAAGTIRQLDSKLVAQRPLQFQAYDLLRENQNEIPSYETAYEILREIGISRNKQAKVLADIPSVMEYIRFWDEKRSELPFNTDGLVVKINDRALYADLGIVGKAPRGAVAYKYPAEQTTSVVKDIVISIGRTGAATPVAVFDPVVVAGSTVKHASLHNADEIERKDVRIGDTIVIYKAGDIIPQVETVLVELRPKGSKQFNFTKELKRQYPELEFERVEGEVAYRAKGLTGTIILKRSIEHYASKGALDIDTLGEKNVEALIDAGLVVDIAGLYQLKYDDVVKLERFADTSASKLISAIQDAKQPKLFRFIFGLGIRHVGQQTALDLAGEFGSVENLANAPLDDLMTIEGIGQVVAESIVAWFSDEDNIKLLKQLDNLGVKPIAETRGKGPLSGQSFVITGSLESMGRDLAAERIRSLGGTFQTAVGKGTTYLVAGGKVGESKLSKAASYGTKVIKEADLLKIIA